ncbi:MAG TPA: RluA family pseudouridine synthase [Pyrinomonadaceae bacterium]|nr:RluA family pseudouridine synthase [Pyrinomonadaceae bacterium]
MLERFEFQVAREDHKKRLEDFLLDRFRSLSKMYLRETIKTEKCEVNGRLENRGYRLKANDFVEIVLDTAREHSMKPQNIPFEIIFEDEELLVVNKASGMLVHPTHWEKNGTLLNAITYHLNSVNSDKTSFIRPGLVHRLDKDTSGLIVIAKTSRAHRILADHFHRKLIEKRYAAVVGGIVKENEGTIVAPIGRFAEEKLWNIKADGKPAETRFRVVKRSEDSTLLELEPVTGRTNQLRIHCAHIGHPILGDHRYNGREFSRLCLHAQKISFWHPNGNQRLEFEADLPREINP